MKTIIRALFAILNRLTLRRYRVQYTEMPRINGLLHVRNRGTLEIGPGVRINSGLRHNPIGGDASCWLVVANGARIRIGARTGMSNVTLFAMTSIDVGDDVNLGGGCKVYDTDFHPLALADRNGPDAAARTATEPVRIENGAFIGGHSIILKGVTIGANAVIGAGSVVTKSVPANEIWAGNPARFIRAL